MQDLDRMKDGLDFEKQNFGLDVKGAFEEKKILGKLLSLASQQDFWNLVGESSEEEDEPSWRSQAHGEDMLI